MKMSLYFSLVLVVFLLFNSCDTPLSKYEPKNDDEKIILKLLYTYVDARNNGDMNALPHWSKKTGNGFSLQSKREFNILEALV